MKSSSKEFDIEEEKSDQIDISSIKDSFNIVIMGDSLVGKTSILERFCNDFFKKEKYANNSLQIYKKIFIYNKKKYLIKFWDPPSFIDNCNNSEINMFNNCDGILYVCSYDNSASLVHINTWYQFLTQYIDLSTKEMALIVNKKDLSEENKIINENQIDKKSKDLQLQFFEISAKTGENVFISMKKFINKIIDKYKKDNKINGEEEDESTESDNENDEDKDEGCLII
jgi:small GTP-binding protein